MCPLESIEDVKTVWERDGAEQWNKDQITPALHVSVKVPDAGGPDNQIDFVIKGNPRPLETSLCLASLNLQGEARRGRDSQS